MKHLFILGCHRSGTTMLQQALNRHSRIAIPPETKYFSSFLGHSHRCQICRVARIKRDLDINVSPPARRIHIGNARFFFQEIACAYLDRLNKPGVVYFGEKTPAHSGYVSQIQCVFPDAKFIWIYRDGRDVALSMRNVGWMNADLATNFIIWLFYYRKQTQAARAATPSLLFVRYEDLVARPELELSRVTDFLGLPFEIAMACGHGNRDGILSWEFPWKERALEPIRADRIGLWRTELSRREVELLEWLGGSALHALGYELTATTRRPWNVIRYPGILWGMIRFLYRSPLDEAANQLLGRAICLR